MHGSVCVCVRVIGVIGAVLGHRAAVWTMLHPETINDECRVVGRHECVTVGVGEMSETDSVIDLIMLYFD